MPLNLAKQDTEDQPHDEPAPAPPIVVRKMTNDPEEMFFLDYWSFDPKSNHDLDAESEDSQKDDKTRQEDTPPLQDRDIAEPDLPNLSPNTSTLAPQAPLLLHTYTTTNVHPRDLSSTLQKRAFACPRDTNACTSISRPNSCCSTSSTCVLTSDDSDDTNDNNSDSDIGEVGCCPRGSECGGGIQGCDTDAGYSSCPGSPNGGCCIPGYRCEDVGCVAGGSSTTVRDVVVTVTENAGQQRTSTTPTPEPSSVADDDDDEGAVGGVIGISTVTVTTTVTPSISATTSNDITAAGAAPPVRPTSNGSPPRSTTLQLTTYTVTRSALSSSASVCPTGYYQCVAVYNARGACCQVGRDCSSTSCVLAESTTVLDSGATIVVPGNGVESAVLATASTTPDVYVTTEVVGSAEVSASVTGDAGAGGGGGVAATATNGNVNGGCATGWSACPATASLANGGAGGCCPSGYSCGASCTATAGNLGGPSELAKVPNGGVAGVLIPVGFMWMVVGAFVAMILTGDVCIL
ncbi:MAG: hypothetical protein M1831_004167 [Alyxoria varia]|nr:MAG: hypothetical protein M1831_004167 [Alyxoria varia]